MVDEVVGIRFKPCGKLYDFDAAGIELKPGDIVVVESELGLSIGKVVCKSRPGGMPHPEKEGMTPAEGGMMPGKGDTAAPSEGGMMPLPEKEGTAPPSQTGAMRRKDAHEYKKVMRLASEEDIRESKANAELEKEAFAFCRERVMARGLQMKLIRTEATLDRKRILFYFIAEKRIDFRELVKDLAQKFRTRIEMRQVGVRDEAKMTGGLGLCGRQLCCTSFLVDFAPISIKMAKKQELVLNTGKLSGICGRLMCCLSYEYGGNPCEGCKDEPEEVLAAEKNAPEEAAVAGVPAAPGATEAAPPLRPDLNSPEAPARMEREREREKTPHGHKNRRFEPGPRHFTGRHAEKEHARARGLGEERPHKADTGTDGIEKRAVEPIKPEGAEAGRGAVQEPHPPQAGGPQTAGQEARRSEPGSQNPSGHSKRKRKRRWRKRGRNGGHEGSQNQNLGPSGN